MCNVLVCNTVKDRCGEMYDEIESVLRDTLGDRYQTYTTDDFCDLHMKERNAIWKDLRFLCLHADTSEFELAERAVRHGIPVIFVRDKDLPKFWIRRLQYLGVMSEEIKDLDCAKKRIYFVSDLADIRGAVKWVTHYFHPIKTKAVDRGVRHALDTISRATT